MRAMVLLSGGVDSATCLADAVEKYGKENVTALSIFYGQKHAKELEASKNIAGYYGVEHIFMDLLEIFKYSDCTLLEHSSGDIPKKSYAEQLSESKGETVSTYVPFRNGLFLSAAASIALSKKCSVIYYGAHGDDAAGNAYPDCSESFNNAMADAIRIGSGEMLRLEAPFVNVSKSDVVRRGIELKVPYKLTWSCYEGGDKPCGKCGTCMDRRKAFEINGITEEYDS